MKLTSLERQRRIFLLCSSSVFGLLLLWQFSDGLPILFGPTASAAEKQSGMELFTHEWQVNDPLAHGDGLGPVFNAKSCVACHFQGGVGGAGGNKQNVNNFTALPSTTDSELQSGTIHSFAVADKFKESFELVRKQFPIIPASSVTRTADHCTYVEPIPAQDPLRTDTVQSVALFGAGWADRVSDKAILNNHRRNQVVGAIDDLQLNFDSIPQGRPRFLADGRVGKFGWKAQFATLEEFVAAACSNEIGLGTPKMAQAQPFGQPDYQIPENPDLDKKQFRALVGFVSTLPKPIEKLPADEDQRQTAIDGKKIFKEIGCAVCHVPDMGGVKGIYTDFLLHTLTDHVPGGGGNGYGPPRPNVPLPKGFPDPDEWKTPVLWGVADSAPYMHDGSAPDLKAAILRHGGDAKTVREAYKALKPNDQQALLAFLNTLKAPEAAIAVASK